MDVACGIHTCPLGMAMKGHGGAAKTGGVPCGRPGKNCQTQKEPNKQAPAAPALSEAVCLLLLRVRDHRW